MALLRISSSLSLFLLCMLIFSCRKKTVVPTLPDFSLCEEVLVKGRLSYHAQQKAYQFVTNGGHSIKFAGTTLTATYDNRITVQFWGIPYTKDELRHENFNGKHIKDWAGTTRSFIFPDGCKLTYKIHNDDKRTVYISIFDGDEAHFFNARCDDTVEGSNTLIYSELNRELTKAIDDSQPDGETATLRIIPTGVLYLNIYTEDEPGKKVEKELPLGSTVNGQPTLVNDLYDDPRLAHT